MSNAFDVQQALKAKLANNVPLSNWVQATFNKPLTVLLGNRPLKQLKAGYFPVVSIVSEPTDLERRQIGEHIHLVESYHVNMGMLFSKASPLDAAHLQAIAEFEHWVATALLEDSRLGGLVKSTKPLERFSDVNIHHPHHFFTLVLQIERTGSY